MNVFIIAVLNIQNGQLTQSYAAPYTVISSGAVTLVILIKDNAIFTIFKVLKLHIELLKM